MRIWAFAFLLVAASPAPSQTFTGEWQEFTILGDSQWDEGRCAMAFFLERRWDLQSRPNSPEELYGGYAVVMHGRMYRNERGDCRAPGQKSASSMLANIRLWTAEGFSSGTTARLQARYDKCLQDNCNDPSLSKAGFIASLKLDGDRLVDTDEASPGESRAVFRHGEWYQARSVEAMAGYQELLDLLASGTGDQIRARLSPAMTADQATTLIASLPILRSYLASIDSREAIEVRVADPPPHATNQFGLQHAALLIYQANGTDGTKHPETVFLHKHNGVWKLSGLH